MNDMTFAMIKPDAVAAGHIGTIISAIEREHITIVSMVMVQWPKEDAEAFYQEHAGKPFYPRLVEFMASGALVMLVLQGENVVTRWRDMMGATDPKKAAPDCLRSLGTEMPLNVVHGSDSEESALREIDFFWRMMKESS